MVVLEVALMHLWAPTAVVLEAAPPAVVLEAAETAVQIEAPGVIVAAVLIVAILSLSFSSS